MSADSWPRNGQIEMINVCLRYREGLPLVLDNVTLSIKSKEKIGIVGRQVKTLTILNFIQFNLIQILFDLKT